MGSQLIYKNRSTYPLLTTNPKPGAQATGTPHQNAPRAHVERGGRPRFAAARTNHKPSVPNYAPRSEAPLVLEPRPAPVEIVPLDPENDAPTFAQLGVAGDIIKALTANGIEAPFAIQTQAIPVALSGRDLCGKARTGSGKTLAFGIPLLQLTGKSAPRHPRAIVLVPTRELASQVAKALLPLAAARRLRLTTIYGGVSAYHQVSALRMGVDIVIATPGRLNDLLQRGDLTVADVETVVLDEADQMADMGFLPQVERILSQVEVEHQTLLFSATLDGDIDQLVRRFQTDPVFIEVEQPEEMVDTMKHRFIGVSEVEKLEVAVAIASGPERTLIFVRTQRNADRLVEQFARLGLRSMALHGGLSQAKRERALSAFQSGWAPVLVATNLAARGIHVDAIETVIHYDFPDEYKAYVHRSGRTARAGASGVVVTLVLPMEERAFADLRRRAGLTETLVAMKPDDERLRDLAGWEPPMFVEPEPMRRNSQPPAGMQRFQNRQGPVPRQREWTPRGDGNRNRRPQRAIGSSR